MKGCVSPRKLRQKSRNLLPFPFPAAKPPFWDIRLDLDVLPSDFGPRGHLCGGARSWSSPDGQDEAIDTLIVLLRLIGGFPGGGDGSYVLLAAVGADDGAGGRQDASASIRSSPDGQDEAIDTPTTLLPSLQVHMSGDNPAFLYRFYP